MDIDPITKNKLAKIGCRTMGKNRLLCKGNTVQIHEYTKKQLHKTFGRDIYGTFLHNPPRAIVRKELPSSVKNHVLIHELEHYIRSNPRELSTNIHSFMIDPKGWTKTAKMTLLDRERRDFYSKKYLKKWE